MQYIKPRGTKDILPEDAEKRFSLEIILRKIMTNYNFKEIITPILENYDLFVRTVGNDSDIVNKEMFLVKNMKSDENTEPKIVLRPEATASVVRTINDSKLLMNLPIKLFYYGPMFRYERPQAGRYRQFYQFGVESLGSNNYLIDIEIITLAITILKTLNLTNFTLKINSIGSTISRNKYIEVLKNDLNKIKSNLCNDCQTRINKNPLRILDCKIDTNLKNIANIHDYLTEQEKENFNNIKIVLNQLNIKYEIDSKLVRGLDYYNDLVFEIKDNNNGLTLVAGGRYDQLSSQLGGKDLPAIGFAMGIERLILALDQAEILWHITKKLDAYIICMSENSRNYASSLIYHLRNNQISANMDYLNRPFKKQIENLDKINCKFAIIIGQKEIENKTVMVKNQKDKTQEEVLTLDLINYLKEGIKKYVKNS